MRTGLGVGCGGGNKVELSFHLLWLKAQGEAEVDIPENSRILGRGSES